MSFFKKIFISILIMASLSSALIATAIYFVFKKNIEVEFIDRYRSDEDIISNTFSQLELTSDIKNKIAVLMLSEIEKRNGIPSNNTLDNLAKKLNINGFYIINKKGRFIRSSDIPVKLQHNSLFSYDPAYKNLISGSMDVATTPMIPSYPNDIPAKLTMIPNYNKKLILESSTHLEYIEKILHEVISKNKNIKSIGLYAQTGYELGSITSDGTFHQGRRNVNNNLFLNNYITGNSLFITTKILSRSQNCVECKIKNVSPDGKYYYLLTFETSVAPLMNQIIALRYQVGTILIIILVISVILSAWISKKLVIRIKKINAAVNNIIDHKNLNSYVTIGGKDEIAKLAASFNKMIESLQISQAALIDSEKKSALFDLSARVAHDIFSPIVAMEMSLQHVEEKYDEKAFYIIRTAIQRMRDIANNLLTQYRNQPDCTSFFIKTLLEEVTLLKRNEWLSKNCDLKLFFSQSIGGSDKITGDISEIKRMLSNLLNNAIEACEACNAPAKIEIHVKNDAEFIQIDISDNGSGIPKEKLNEYLNGKSSKHAGSGLGLVNARKYMENIHGELSLISQQGTGTTVTLKFKHTIFDAHI